MQEMPCMLPDHAVIFPPSRSMAKRSFCSQCSCCVSILSTDHHHSLPNGAGNDFLCNFRIVRILQFKHCLAGIQPFAKRHAFENVNRSTIVCRGESLIGLTIQFDRPQIGTARLKTWTAPPDRKPSVLRASGRPVFLFSDGLRTGQWLCSPRSQWPRSA